MMLHLPFVCLLLLGGSNAKNPIGTCHEPNRTDGEEWDLNNMTYMVAPECSEMSRADIRTDVNGFVEQDSKIDLCYIFDEFHVEPILNGNPFAAFGPDGYCEQDGLRWCYCYECFFIRPDQEFVMKMKKNLDEMLSDDSKLIDFWVKNKHSNFYVAERKHENMGWGRRIWRWAKGAKNTEIVFIQCFRRNAEGEQQIRWITRDNLVDFIKRWRSSRLVPVAPKRQLLIKFDDLAEGTVVYSQKVLDDDVHVRVKEEVDGEDDKFHDIPKADWDNTTIFKPLPNPEDKLGNKPDLREEWNKKDGISINSMILNAAFSPRSSKKEQASNCLDGTLSFKTSTSWFTSHHRKWDFLPREAGRTEMQRFLKNTDLKTQASNLGMIFPGTSDILKGRANELHLISVNDL